jgi:hypothetical protein
LPIPTEDKLNTSGVDFNAFCAVSANFIVFSSILTAYKDVGSRDVVPIPVTEVVAIPIFVPEFEL